MEYALEGKNSILVTYRGGKIGYVTLDEVVGNNTKIGAASRKHKRK